MASRLADESPELIAGLVLIGTTHPRDIDLSESGLAVTKILGTQDGVATVEKARINANRMPETARWIEIEGANHAQFGYYGPSWEMAEQASAGWVSSVSSWSFCLRSWSGPCPERADQTLRWKPAAPDVSMVPR